MEQKSEKEKGSLSASEMLPLAAVLRCAPETHRNMERNYGKIHMENVSDAENVPQNVLIRNFTSQRYSHEKHWYDYLWILSLTYLIL